MSPSRRSMKLRESAFVVIPNTSFVGGATWVITLAGRRRDERRDEQRGTGMWVSRKRVGEAGEEA